MAPKGKSKIENTEIVITPPNFQVLETTIVGSSILVSNNFAQEQIEQMGAAQALGAQAGSKKKRDPKDFEASYRGSMHVSEEGWIGMPVTSFRAALIRACSTCGIEMVRAKMCFFVLADGFEVKRGTPLVRITKGKPERFDSYVRNANGSADIRARARWAAGWECVLRVRYDKDLFSAETVANLIQRAGISVGIGAGRPFSTASAGQGWGTFEIKGSTQQVKAPTPKVAA
jgi:hypothetical protein